MQACKALQSRSLLTPQQSSKTQALLGCCKHRSTSAPATCLALGTFTPLRARVQSQPPVSQDSLAACRIQTHV